MTLSKNISPELRAKVLSPYAIPKKPPVIDPCETCIVTVTCTDLCEDKALFNLFDGFEDRGKEIKVRVEKRRKR